MKKILIIAGFNNKNLGDDLMFATVINTLDYDEYYMYGPEIIPAGVKKDIKFIKYGRAILLRWKFKADFAIVGGSLFMGENDIQMSMFDWKIKLLKLNKYFRGRNLILGANLGPFRDEDEYSEKLKKVIALTDIWKVRDEFSYQLLKKFKAKSVSLIPDLVMGFDLSKYKSQKEIKKICISVTDVDKDGAILPKQKLYESELVYLIEYYYKLGYKIDLVSFEDSKDLKVINNIINLIPSDYKVSVVRNIDEEVFQSLASAEKVISTRFHCMVLSALLEKEQIIYGYSRKTKNFATKYGFAVYEITGDASQKRMTKTAFSTESLNEAKNTLTTLGIINEN